MVSAIEGRREAEETELASSNRRATSHQTEQQLGMNQAEELATPRPAVRHSCYSHPSVDWLVLSGSWPALPLGVGWGEGVVRASSEYFTGFLPAIETIRQSILSSIKSGSRDRARTPSPGHASKRRVCRRDVRRDCVLSFR